jgi:hypothetical protein
MGKTLTNRRLYIDILRGMTPEQRLLKSYELTYMTRELLRAGLRRLHPELSSDELQALLCDRLLHWHNKTS